jgi:MYXO-CTERM domain-containing protein
MSRPSAPALGIIALIDNKRSPQAQRIQRGIHMTCLNFAARRLALAGFALMALVGTAGAQTYTAGGNIWTNTLGTVGMTNCTSCHGGSAPSLATLRGRFQTLTQTQVRAQLDTAISGPMAGLYTNLAAGDRDSLSLYLGNFIAVVSTAASVPLASLTATAVNTPSASTVTVTNAGRANLTVASTPVSGTNATEFVVAGVGNGCIAQTVAPNATCQITVTFTPTATGVRTATLTLNHNGDPNTTVLQLSGQVSTSGGGGNVAPVGGSDDGGAVWPWALLLIGAAALRRRRG